MSNNMIMGILCCLCECCFPDKGLEGGQFACCLCVIGCYQGYKENVSGKRRRTYRFLNSILVLILSIVALILSSIILSKTSLSGQQINNILENWQLGVLTDIQIVDDCPLNYEIVSTHKIPGTTSGCICLDDKEIQTYGCSDWQILTGCYNAQTKEPIDLLKWVQPSNNSFKAIQICGQRSELLFYDLLKKKITTEDDCKSNGYKVCSTQSAENFYCVLEQEPCPIRDFKITQYQLTEFELQLNNYSLIYDNGFYAYTSQYKETTPLINMNIVKGKGVCFDQNELSLNPKINEDYPLFTPQPDDCDLDNTYYQLSITDEKALFSFNNVFSLVQAERPLYNISSNIEYQLLAQNQIFYKQNCRIDNFEQIIGLGSKFDNLKILIICQLVFACVLFIVMVVISLNETHRCFYNDCCTCYSKGQLVAKEISIYLLAITVIVSYSVMINLVLKLEEQNSKKCFPNSGQERMNLIYNTLASTSLSLSYSLLINIGLMIIIDFSMTTFLWFKIYKKTLGRLSTSHYHYNKGQNNQDPNQNQNPIQYQDPYLKQEYQQPAPLQYQQNDPFQYQQQPAPLEYNDQAFQTIQEQQQQIDRVNPQNEGIIFNQDEQN